MRRPRLTGTAKLILAAWAAATLAGCGSGNVGSFDQPDSSSRGNSITSRFGNLLAFNKLTGPPAATKEAERLECPGNRRSRRDGGASRLQWRGVE